MIEFKINDILQYCKLIFQTFYLFFNLYTISGSLSKWRSNNRRAKPRLILIRCFLRRRVFCRPRKPAHNRPVIISLRRPAHGHAGHPAAPSYIITRGGHKSDVQTGAKFAATHSNLLRLTTASFKRLKKDNITEKNRFKKDK